MKLFVVLVCAVIFTVKASPLGGYHDSSVADIVNFENYNSGKNGYRYQFDTSDGTSRVEAGELKDLGYDSERLAVMGSYTFVDDKGKEHTVEYTADEKGYRAKVKYSS
ncbi:endocuticle structural glycoprotein ABD-5-like [Culicoides brevitarsis]|uniref:endocuticle structural glycoprotein ABD-5-like n=1 Tax=Culicoides brevitarsis TaxID=469753 RepID=UPI00307B7538